MSKLRALAHLEEQLGDERFGALISSDNTGIVKKFCDQLIMSALPTKMTVCGRHYEILGFRRDGDSMNGQVMVDRAKEMDANLGQDDAEHILKYQNEIPVALCGKVTFVFPDWRLSRLDPGFVYYVRANGPLWEKHFYQLNGVSCYDGARLLRRKQEIVA